MLGSCSVLQVCTLQACQGECTYSIVYSSTVLRYCTEAMSVDYVAESHCIVETGSLCEYDVNDLLSILCNGNHCSLFTLLINFYE